MLQSLKLMEEVAMFRLFDDLLTYISLAIGYVVTLIFFSVLLGFAYYYYPIITTWLGIGLAVLLLLGLLGHLLRFIFKRFNLDINNNKRSISLIQYIKQQYNLTKLTIQEPTKMPSWVIKFEKWAKKFNQRVEKFIVKMEAYNRTLKDKNKEA